MPSDSVQIKLPRAFVAEHLTPLQTAGRYTSLKQTVMELALLCGPALKQHHQRIWLEGALRMPPETLQDADSIPVASCKDAHRNLPASSQKPQPLRMPPETLQDTDSIPVASCKDAHRSLPASSQKPLSIPPASSQDTQAQPQTTHTSGSVQIQELKAGVNAEELDDF